MGNDRLKQTILVVDDMPENIDVLNGLLKADYQVRVALNGANALKIAAAEHPPDLILLDIMMPGMDGYQVCKSIRANASLPYIPIIFLTATDIDKNEMTHAFDIGGDDFVRKPFKTLELLSRIRAALRVKDLYDELSRTKAELSKYVSLSTLAMVEKVTSGKISRDGETADVTVLFSDMRGYTSISENMNPSDVFEMLNIYLAMQIDIIEKHHGIIDKLTGDEVMAVFHGAEMVQNALECGAAIISALCNAKSCTGSDWIGVGIGINTGPVYVGSIGSHTRKDYTVVGKTVNIAARLCGFAKKFQILFTESTKNLIAGKELRYESVGAVPLKGLSLPIEVFELK